MMPRLRRDLVLRWTCCRVEIGKHAQEHEGQLSATPEGAAAAHGRFIEAWERQGGAEGYRLPTPPECRRQPLKQPVLCDTDGRVLALLDPRAVEVPKPIARQS